MLDRAELRRLVARHAAVEGRNQSAVPEVWFYRSDRRTTFRRSVVPAPLLAVIVQGRKVARIDDRELSYDPETYLVITGESEFDTSILDAHPDEPYLSMSVLLSPERVVQTLLTLRDEALGDAAAEPPAPAYVSRLDPPLIDTLARLARTLDDPAERRIVAPLVLSELVFRLLRTEAAAAVRRAAQRQGDQARIVQAMTYMRENLARRLTVASVARQVAMSPSHFAHRFRDVARTSPMQYLKQIRLREARQLLLEAGARPADAAAKVGYQSAAHFSRDFKDHFALPPAAYARRFHEASQDPARRSQPPPSP